MSNKPTEKENSLPVQGEETEYYQRINVMLVDLGTDTLLKLFKSLIPNDDVKRFLNSNDKELKKRLSKDQYRRISKETFDETELDIAILIKLMLEILPQQLEEAHRARRNPPLKTDLNKLRTIRNELVGHRPVAKISKEDFIDKWEKISLILTRILPDSQLKEELDGQIKHYETCTLSPSSVKKILDKLQELSSLLEQAKEELREKKEFQLFFKNPPEQYIRYIKLLFDGGGLILLGVLHREMKRENVSFDNLKYHEQLPSNIKDILSSPAMNPLSLDITVLAEIILTLFGDKMSQSDNKHIQIIRDARNSYADTAKLSLDDKTFLSKWTILVRSLDFLSMNIDEKSKDKYEDMMQQYQDGNFDGTTADEYLNQLKTNGMDIRTLQEVYADMLSEFKNLFEKVDDAGLPLQEKLELHVVIHCKNPEIERMVEDDLQANIQTAVKSLDKPDAYQQPSEVDSLLQEITGKEGGVTITGVFKKCIIIVLQVPTYRAMNYLINFVQSANFGVHIGNVSRMLCLKYEEAISVQAKFTFESMKNLSDHITQQIDMRRSTRKRKAPFYFDSDAAELLPQPAPALQQAKMMSRPVSVAQPPPVLPQAVPAPQPDPMVPLPAAVVSAPVAIEHPQDVIDQEHYRHGEKHGVQISIGCSSATGIRHVVEVLTKQKFTNALNKVAESLSDRFGETVTLIPVPDFKELNEIFHDQDSRTDDSSTSKDKNVDGFGKTDEEKKGLKKIEEERLQAEEEEREDEVEHRRRLEEKERKEEEQKRMMEEETRRQLEVERQKEIQRQQEIQLKNQQINIRQRDETRLIHNRKEALFELEGRTAEGLREIDDSTATPITSTFQKDVDNRTNKVFADTEQTKATANVKGEKRSALSDIEEAKRVAEHVFENKTIAALSVLKQARNGAAHNVNKSAKDALSELEDARKRILQDVKENTKDALSKLEEAKKGTEQDVEQSTKDALSKLYKVKNGATQDVEESTKAVLFELEEANKKVAPGVEESTIDALSELEKSNKVAVQTVEEIKNDVLSEVARQGVIQELKENTRAALSELEEVGKGDAQDVMECPKPVLSKLAEDLRQDLVKFYKDSHSSIPLSPLFEKHDTPLVDFYVLPQMNSIKVQSMFSEGREIKTPIKLSDMFKSGSKRSREIYLIADAGLGKTAFSKYLAVTWCQAHRPEKKIEKYFPEDAIDAMSEFDFLFLVLLRDSSEDCSIDNLIVNQIVQNLSLSCTMTISSLQEILHRERCLIILDGLDEWTHPMRKCLKVPKTIPHRNAREKCTVLTTTRPWKLSVINLTTSQIDKKVELVKLTSQSVQALKERAIAKIKHLNVFDAKRLAKGLTKKIKEKQLQNLESVPLLSMYLICLWCDGLPLGQSKSEVYTNIIELLLSRTVSIYPELEITSESSQSDIPQFWSEHVHCKKYYALLKALGQLAFETLFSKQRESTLVFSQSVTEMYLNKDDLKLCLLSGILTQSKEVKLIKQSYKVSFSHKTMQEYFCALHFCCQNENDVEKFVLHRFNSVQNILDMSTVFLFISGMNAEIMSSISRELMSVISEDQITRTYRRMAHYNNKYVYPLKDIQDMYISCLKENPHNTSLCFQDFIIDLDYQKEKHFLALKWLAKHNKRNMYSILIGTCGHCLRDIIDQCELDDWYSVKKIFYQGEYKEAEIIRLLTNKSLECVTVQSSIWQGNSSKHELDSCSSELSKTFQNISQLRTLCIEGFKMEHDVLKEFLNYIINRKSMTEISLYNLNCVTHGISCGEMNLDFSQHTDLRALALSYIPVSELKVNVSSLEECGVGRLSKPGLVTSFLRQLPAASKLHSFSCSSLESSGAIEALLQTLPLLVPVKEIMLVDINLGERSLSLSPEMVNITLVYMEKVTMSGSSLRNLVKVVEKFPQSVMVTMRDYNITPETEFEAVKKYITTSEDFIVTFDGSYQFNKCVFEFQTTEAGSRVH